MFQGAKFRKHTHAQAASPQPDVRALALSSAENAAACNIALVPSNTNSASKMSFPLSRRWLEFLKFTSISYAHHS